MTPEDKARAEKAARLVEAVLGLGRLAVAGEDATDEAILALAGADTAERMDPAQRGVVARLAGVRPPSDTTWALVVRVLRARGKRSSPSRH